MIGLVAATDDWLMLGAPAFTTTDGFCVISTEAFTVAVTTFVPAPVELNVPVITPLAFVVPTGCVTVFPAPVAARVTVAPLIGLSNTSRTVTVTVELLEPLLAVLGLVAATDD